VVDDLLDAAATRDTLDIITDLAHPLPATIIAELLATCVFLLFAGHQTTTNLIGNAVMALLRHLGQEESAANTAVSTPTPLAQQPYRQAPVGLGGRKEDPFRDPWDERRPTSLQRHR
jgi:cytochrome P450